MRPTYIALGASMMLGVLSTAWADPPVPPSDPAEFEIIAVKPRSADAKPVVSSVPVQPRAETLADGAARNTSVAPPAKTGG